MYNIITGQCTADIIAVIRNHVAINNNSNKHDLISDKNVHFNRERRFEFNHNFNRNNYVRSK